MNHDYVLALCTSIRTIELVWKLCVNLTCKLHTNCISVHVFSFIIGYFFQNTDGVSFMIQCSLLKPLSCLRSDLWLWFWPPKMLSYVLSPAENYLTSKIIFDIFLKKNGIIGRCRFLKTTWIKLINDLNVLQITCQWIHYACLQRNISFEYFSI